MLLISALYSEKPEYDQLFLQNYIEINILPKLRRVQGVGSASAFGQMTYSMRIWLKPDVMSVYGIVPGDIVSALNDQNIEAAPGRFGEQGDQSFQYVIRFTGKLQTIEEFENVIIRAENKKNAGVPVLASVAAILPPMWPDFPMPVTTTRPVVARHSSQAAAKVLSRRCPSRLTARDSISRTRPASASISC
jgi:multidrug efflux pump subunit AcrB